VKATIRHQPDPSRGAEPGAGLVLHELAVAGGRFRGRVPPHRLPVLRADDRPLEAAAGVGEGARVDAAAGVRDARRLRSGGDDGDRVGAGADRFRPSLGEDPVLLRRRERPEVVVRGCEEAGRGSVHLIDRHRRAPARGMPFERRRVGVDPGEDRAPRAGAGLHDPDVVGVLPADRRSQIRGPGRVSGRGLRHRREIPRPTRQRLLQARTGPDQRLRRRHRPVEQPREAAPGGVDPGERCRFHGKPVPVAAGLRHIPGRPRRNCCLRRGHGRCQVRFEARPRRVELGRDPGVPHPDSDGRGPVTDPHDPILPGIREISRRQGQEPLRTAVPPAHPHRPRRTGRTRGGGASARSAPASDPDPPAPSPNR
jgi:hypothetical protein